MAEGVLLDTSFLICFADPTQRHHETARRYMDFFASEGVLMYLSTVVAAEFQLGQPVQDLPLDAFQVLPFGLRAAIASAELEKKRVPDPEAKTPRAALKDDMKLLGQAKAGAIACVITDDESSLFKWCERLRQSHELTTRPIKLSAGFDRSHFDPAQQHHIEFNPPAHVAPEAAASMPATPAASEAPAPQLPAPPGEG